MSLALAARKVLVLNKSWRPINILSLEDALTKVCSQREEERARIIDCNSFVPMTWEDWSAQRPQEGEEFIRGTKTIYRIPTVILASKYDHTHNKKAHYCRRTVYKRDNYTCQYCGCRPGSEELTIDHVLPRAQGGLTTWENCVLACVTCNFKKANRTPEQACMKLLKKPKKPTSNLFRTEHVVKDWEAFLGVNYWLTELDNDNE